MTAGTRYSAVEDDVTGTGGAVPSCGWGCYHVDVKWAFHKTETGEVFEHTDLVILHQWLGEFFNESMFAPHVVRRAVLDSLKQSAQDHDVGDEAVSLLHVIIYDKPNEWKDTVWVSTQYRVTREKHWNSYDDMDGYTWRDVEPRTYQATYGWNEDRGAACYCD